MGNYLTKIGFFKGTIDSNLYLKATKNGFLIIVIFFDDIIFGCNDEASDKFAKELKNEFKRSMIEEMKLF